MSDSTTPDELPEYIIETPDMVVTGRDLTELLLPHIQASWAKIAPEFAAVLRKLKHVETLDVIDAFQQMAIQEGRRALYAEIGLLFPDMNLAISDDFLRAATARRRQRQRGPTKYSEQEMIAAVRAFAKQNKPHWKFCQEYNNPFGGFLSESTFKRMLSEFRLTYGDEREYFELI
mgnify:FL=1